LTAKRGAIATNDGERRNPTEIDIGPQIAELAQ
jgi:hypothetical protein